MVRTLDMLSDEPLANLRPYYKTARGRLAAFLTDLDPLFRKFLTGDHLDTFDGIDFLELDERGEHSFKVAEKQYFALLEAVSKEGRRRRAVVYAEFRDNAQREILLLEKGPAAPGAPTKRLNMRRDVRISIEAERLIRHLRRGVERVRSLKKESRHGSDATARHLLRGLQYDSDEIDAIIAADSVRSAAARLLVRRYEFGRPVATIQAAITRGRRLRRAATYRRTPS